MKTKYIFNKTSKIFSNTGISHHIIKTAWPGNFQEKRI